MRSAADCSDSEVTHDEAGPGSPSRRPWWPVLLARLYRPYFRTLRIHGLLPDGTSATAENYSYDTAIYAHCESDLLVLAGLSLFSPFTVLIARGRDGDWASQAAETLGSRVVRGSSLHDGRRAANRLIDALLADPRPAGICVDGPAGPPGVAKTGVFYLALHTQRPVIPVAVAALRTWVFTKSWSRLFLPRPFSPLVISVGPALRIKEGAGRKDIGALARQLSSALARERQRAKDTLMRLQASR